MSSGVGVTNECVTAFKDMKMGHQYSYILYGLSDDMQEIVVQKRGGKDEGYEDLVEHFREAERCGQGRYALYDLDYTTLSGTAKSKILFFAWAPETAPVKQKMLLTTSKGALRKALGNGIGKEVQANDEDDLDLETIIQEIHKSDRN